MTQTNNVERLIPESQIKAVVKDMVREILSEMLGVVPVTKQQQWYDAEAAYERLALDSAKQLRAMVRDGRLRLGHEVRDLRSPNSQIPRYQFHIDKCEARLLIAPEKRTRRKAV